MKLFILGILGYCILEMSSAGVNQWASQAWWEQAQIVLDAQLGPLPNDIASYESVLELWNVASGGESTKHTLDIDKAGYFFFSMITTSIIRPILPNNYHVVLERIFEQVDSNGDKRIDFTEFKITLNILATVEARVAILAYDVDENGLLDRVEMKPMMENISNDLASYHYGSFYYMRGGLREQLKKPPFNTILNDNEWTIEELVELFIGFWGMFGDVIWEF